MVASDGLRELGALIGSLLAVLRIAATRFTLHPSQLTCNRRKRSGETGRMRGRRRKQNPTSFTKSVSSSLMGKAFKVGACAAPIQCRETHWRGWVTELSIQRVCGSSLSNRTNVLYHNINKQCSLISFLLLPRTFLHRVLSDMGIHGRRKTK